MQELESFFKLLKTEPDASCEVDGQTLRVGLFTTIYFVQDRCEEAVLKLIERHEAFEQLPGRPPYLLGVHPKSHMVHPYGSKRIGNLREHAQKTRPRHPFSFSCTDQQRAVDSPSFGCSFRRASSEFDSSGPQYSYIQFYYPWPWWMENRLTWQCFVWECIEQLSPEVAYSGICVARPMQLEHRSDSAACQLGSQVAGRFHGLDIDRPYDAGASDGLPTGLRPPTWGFFLSDIWLRKLCLERGDARQALAEPAISIREFAHGQWIELGPHPQLHPVEHGVPELPARLNRLLRPARHPWLKLPGFGVNEEYDRPRLERWLARFDDESRSSPICHASVGSARHLGQLFQHRPPCTFCPHTGWWQSFYGHGVCTYFHAGDVLPDKADDSPHAVHVWRWCDGQDQSPPERSGPLNGALSDQPAPRTGFWQALDAPTVRCSAAAGELLPRYQGAVVLWCWLEVRTPDWRQRSGEACRYSGLWYCEDRPTGLQAFQRDQALPPIDASEVTWVLESRTNPEETAPGRWTDQELEAGVAEAATRFMQWEAEVNKLPTAHLLRLRDIQINSASEDE